VVNSGDERAGEIVRVIGGWNTLSVLEDVLETGRFERVGVRGSMCWRDWCGVGTGEKRGRPGRGLGNWRGTIRGGVGD
jgi:hypothetical protein